ncbi:MAG TPA: tetratricopeptide repeat protein [Pyrinomonadaceae bacterium]
MRQPLLRALLIVPALLMLAISWYAVRWYVGDFVAEFAPRMEEKQMDAAEAAMNLAPADPWTHWVVAGLEKRSFLPEDLADAVRHYEEAVRLSPNDYRFWMDLGRAREETGDREGGEKALRRAVELAPAYAYPRWYLGNLLLRAGRGEEAFKELQRAAEADPTMRPQLFNVAWTLYGQDIESIKKAVGEAPAARAEFAVYLVGRGRLDDALGIWSGLTPAEKKGQSEAGIKIMNALLEKKHFHEALDVFSGMSPGIDAKPSHLINGGFEDDIYIQAGNPFGWQIKNDPAAQIAIDPRTQHSGARSLGISFQATENLTFNNVTQLIAVEPSTQYRLEYYVRAQDLKSGGMPLVIVLDATDGSTALGTSQPLSPGTYDWQPVTINFKTPPKTEAVLVKIVRAQCGGEAVCPILGIVWYDDFNLQAGGGAANPRDSRKGNANGK